MEESVIVNVDKISASQRELEVTIDAEQAKKIKDRIVKFLHSKVQYPGFRKGKAPLSLFIKKYNNLIEEEFNKAVVQETFKEALEQAKIEYLGDKNDLEINKAEDGSVVYIVTIETHPEFELKDYKNLEIEIPKGPEFTEKFVEEQLNLFLMNYQKFEKTDGPFEPDYFAKVEITLKDSDEKETFTRYITNRFPIDKNLPGNILEILKGKKTGDVVEIDYKKDDKVYKADLKIEQIEKTVVPELTDEFVKENFKDMYSSAEEFMTAYRENLKKRLELDVEKVKKEKLLLELLKNNNFDVPMSEMQRIAVNYLEDLKKKEKREITRDDEQNALYYANISLLRKYLYTKIAEAENIEVTNEDLDKFYEENAKAYNMDTKEYKRAIIKAGLLPQIKQNLLEEKVEKFLLENNTFVEKEEDEKEVEEHSNKEGQSDVNTDGN